jgi:hypothetical protein
MNNHDFRTKPSLAHSLSALLVVTLAAFIFAAPLQAQKAAAPSDVYLPNGFSTNLARGPVDMGITDPALIGAIDVHVHVDPDSPGGSSGEEVRAIDVINFARIAKARGMRGFVQKTHLDTSSAATALLVRQEVPGIEVFGRFGQNFPTGGINIASVDQFTQITGGWGRIVEMPTRDSITGWETIQKTGHDPRTWIKVRPPDAPKYVAISKDGKLLPEVIQFIETLAKMTTTQSNGSIVLATGHAAPEEHLLLAREGRRVGLQVLATHPKGIPQMEEIAKTGAFIEINASLILKGKDPTARTSTGDGFTDAIAWIRRVGAESVIISSDCGQITNPLPSDALAMAAKGLRSRGITERELNLMFKENPAKLLGLPPLEPKPAAEASKK